MAALLFAGPGPALPAQGWQVTSNTSVTAEVTLRESWDNNVFLQNRAPSPVVANAAQPFQESWITAVTPRLACTWKPMAEFCLTASYSPDIVIFHEQASESHVDHRVGLLMDGEVGLVKWRMQNSLTVIDGNRDGETFGIMENGAAVGAPVMGAIPIRDRRAALIYRNSFGAFHQYGDWFFRPAVSSYIHDFRTRVMDPTLFPFYQNYVDRNDFNLGLDAGYKATPGGYSFLAYRFGWQHEDHLPGRNVDYSNEYHRLLAGYEGRITDWLRLDLFAGPDWRSFGSHTPVGFKNEQVRVYVDAVATVTASPQDRITVTAKRFEQPGFGSPSVYEDMTYETAWRHSFKVPWSSSLGFRAYGGDWMAPVLRRDWIFTPSATLAWRGDSHWSGELGYSYDWSSSEIPRTTGREYTRHVVSAAVKYMF